MRWAAWLLTIAVIATGLWLLLGRPSTAVISDPARWPALASPGPLSRAHAFLADRCDACHAAAKGPVAARCIACHANAADLLQRQPTAFHASIGSCRECHPEHGGDHAAITLMSHEALAALGLSALESSGAPESEARDRAATVRHWAAGRPAGIEPAADTRTLSPHVRALNCTACHANDDRHFGLFGKDCAACHGTASWNLPQFRHPPPSSRDCEHCHQAPPSHFMGHFKMVSQRIAGKPKAGVQECHRCHQTTAWPDIKGVGWHKHH